MEMARHLPDRNWWMEFKISFVKHADNQQSVDVNQFFVLGLDIDGDGKQLHEFQSYYKINSFSLDRRSAIFTSSVRGSESDPLLNGRRFDGSVKDYPGISRLMQRTLWLAICMQMPVP